jgi:hypothetical protein
LVLQKAWKTVRLHTSTKTAHHWLCCCFSLKFFCCWWNRWTYTTSNTWRDKPDLAADCLTLRCLT